MCSNSSLNTGPVVNTSYTFLSCQEVWVHFRMEDTRNDIDALRSGSGGGDSESKCLKLNDTSAGAAPADTSASHNSNHELHKRKFGEVAEGESKDEKTQKNHEDYEAIRHKFIQEANDAGVATTAHHADDLESVTSSLTTALAGMVKDALEDEAFDVDDIDQETPWADTSALFSSHQAMRDLMSFDANVANQYQDCVFGALLTCSYPRCLLTPAILEILDQ